MTIDIIFKKAYAVIAEPAPPPRLQAYAFKHPTRTVQAASSTHPNNDNTWDDLLKEELWPLYVGMPDLYESFSEKIPHLEENAESCFENAYKMSFLCITKKQAGEIRQKEHRKRMC